MIRTSIHSRISALLLIIGVCLFAAADARAQVAPIIIPLSQPGKPMTLDLNMLSAKLEVIGESRDDVSVEVSGKSSNRRIVTPSGSKPINAASYQLKAFEDGNEVLLRSSWSNSSPTVVVRVPADASLKVRVTNDSDIEVRDVRGDLDLKNVNGPITVTGAAGAVIAESINDDVTIHYGDMRQFDASSLLSVNGTLDLGLPPSAGAEIHIDTSRGEIVSDYEIEVLPPKANVERNKRGSGTEIRVEQVIVGRIKGGGPVILMKTLNGDVSISDSSE
ncbi:MAG: hypothetical protein AAAFM81_10795 [Pseudomonadota bacterium]